MTLIEAAALDPDVVAQLRSVLGCDAVDQLTAAFDAELQIRPREIARHVKIGDLPSARAAAHSLRGAALVVGARAIAAAAGQVERAPARSVDRSLHDLLALTGGAGDATSPTGRQCQR